VVLPRGGFPVIDAIYTALCWAVGGFGSSRIARHYGSAPANGIRLLLASCVQVGLCLGIAGTLMLPAGGWFALAGVLHLAVGDVGLFAAYRRLGPRIGVLMVCSLAPPTALLMEWWTLGIVPGIESLLCALGILLAVAAAVAPRERQHLEPHELRAGLLFGLLAAVGQGMGAAVNRIAFDRLGGVEVTFWLPAFYRVAAGAAGVWLWILLRKLTGDQPLRRPKELIPDKKVEGHPLIWLTISTLLGPVLGMWFLMRAFDAAPSGLVQATLSTLPVFMMPVAWLLDGTVPSRRSVVAGMVAVALTAVLDQL
jgi:drug/metabolite transporter (DMT)-like permease